MDSKTKYGLYALYGLAVLLLSLYIRFPSDAVRHYAERQMEAALPGIEVAVGAARPSFPAAVRLQGIEAQYENQTILALDSVRLSPVWGELLRLTPTWRVTAPVGSGRIRALVRPQGNGSAETVTLRADLDRIELDRLQGMQQLAGRRISGLCSGTISCTRQADKDEMDFRLRLTDAAVKLRQPILQYGQVVLHTAQIEAALTGDVLQIRQLTFQGAEFDGRLAGAIDFKSDIAAGTVALEGTLKPGTALLAQLKKSLPASIMARRGNTGEFEFLLSGSIKNPRFSFR